MGDARVFAMMSKLKKTNEKEDQLAMIEAIEIAQPTQKHENRENTSECIEDLLATLEKLEKEEKALVIEKQRLMTVEKRLRVQLAGAISEKTKEVGKLKDEIKDLKQKCEGLAKALEIPVNK